VKFDVKLTNLFSSLGESTANCHIRLLSLCMFIKQALKLALKITELHYLGLLLWPEAGARERFLNRGGGENIKQVSFCPKIANHLHQPVILMGAGSYSSHLT